jgi:hypothetical protein
VDKDGHDSSRVVGFVGELMATRTLGYETLTLYEWEEGGYLIYTDRSPPLGSRRRWLSHDTKGQGVRGYTAKQVAEKAPDFGEALGFAPRHLPNQRPGSRRGDTGRRAGNDGGTGTDRTFNVAQAALELGVSESYLRTLGNSGQLGVLRRRHFGGQTVYSAMDIRVMKKMGIGRRPRRLRSHSEAVRAVEREQGREEQIRLKRERREEKKRLKEEKREAVRREKAENRRAQEAERPRSWWRRLFGG